MGDEPAGPMLPSALATPSLSGNWARLAEARILYQEAAHCAPADAMQKLDAEHAREEADG